MTDALRLTVMPKHRSSIHQISDRSRRTIQLFRNGDRYFVGKRIGVRTEDYSDLREFLHDLSEAIDLPYGVRRLFTPDQGSEVTDVNILEDGASYVCASFEPFLKLDYTSIAKPLSTFPLEQGKLFFQLDRSFRQPVELGFAFPALVCTLKFPSHMTALITSNKINTHTHDERETLRKHDLKRKKQHSSIH